MKLNTFKALIILVVILSSCRKLDDTIWIDKDFFKINTVVFDSDPNHIKVELKKKNPDACFDKVVETIGTDEIQNHVVDTKTNEIKGSWFKVTYKDYKVYIETKRNNLEENRYLNIFFHDSIPLLKLLKVTQWGKQK